MHISPSWQRSAKVRSGAIIWRCADPARTPEAQDWRVFPRYLSRIVIAELDPTSAGPITPACAVKQARGGQGSLARRGRWLRRLRLGRALLIKRDEIDWIEQQRREAPVAYGRGDDLAREREQQARTLDHDDWLQCLCRHVLDAENASECQVEGKQDRSGALGLAFELQGDFVVGLGKLLGAHVDLNVDRRLRLIGRQGARRVRILEREILDVLPKHAELRLALRSARARRGSAIAAGGGHRLYLSLPTITAVGGVANTGAPVGQGYHAPRLDLRRRRRPRSEIWCHSPGSSSMTRSSRGACRELRANVASFAAAHRRTAGSNNAAPKRSVIKPGNIRKIPPSIVAMPGVSKCSARIPSRAKAVRKRSRSARPNLLSNSTPTMEVAMKRPAAHNQPINAAIRKKAKSSAAGSTSSAINVHLTKDIGPIPAFALGISLVGATVGIVYGPTGATCAGGSAQASGSVRSRTYILVREPISASADFLSAGFPLIPRFRHGGRERARRVRYLHHHLFGAGSIHLPAPAKCAGSAHGSRTAALRPVFRPRCGARCDQ